MRCTNDGAIGPGTTSRVLSSSLGELAGTCDGQEGVGGCSLLKSLALEMPAAAAILWDTLRSSESNSIVELLADSKYLSIPVASEWLQYNASFRMSWKEDPSEEWKSRPVHGKAAGCLSPLTSQPGGRMCKGSVYPLGSTGRDCGWSAPYLTTW